MTVARLKVGERPDRFLHTFLDDDGNVIEITEAFFSILTPDGEAADFEAELVTDGSDGEASFLLAEVEQRGTHTYEFWSEVGGHRYASPTLVFYADPAVMVPGSS